MILAIHGPCEEAEVVGPLDVELPVLVCGARAVFLTRSNSCLKSLIPVCIAFTLS